MLIGWMVGLRATARLGDDLLKPGAPLLLRAYERFCQALELEVSSI